MPSPGLLDDECLLGVQTLHGMLEREIWKQLPIIPGGLPSIRAALDDPSVLAAFPFDTSNFGEWVAHGNPWHMQAYGESRPLGAAAGCVALSLNRVAYADMRLSYRHGQLSSMHEMRPGSTQLSWCSVQRMRRMRECLRTAPAALLWKAGSLGQLRSSCWQIRPLLLQQHRADMPMATSRAQVASLKCAVRRV